MSRNRFLYAISFFIMMLTIGEAHASEEVFDIKDLISRSEITDSGHVTKYKNITYDQSNAFDGSMNTSWCANGGSGNWLEISFPEIIHVNSLRVIPGYGGNSRTYNRNNRVKKATILLSAGKIIEASFVDKIGYQKIEINADTKVLRFEIIEIYKGKIDNDVCVGEILIDAKPIPPNFLASMLKPLVGAIGLPSNILKAITSKDGGISLHPGIVIFLILAVGSIAKRIAEGGHNWGRLFFGTLVIGCIIGAICYSWLFAILFALVGIFISGITYTPPVRSEKEILESIEAHQKFQSTALGLSAGLYLHDKVKKIWNKE